MSDREPLSRRTQAPPPRISLMSWEQARWILEKFLSALQDRYEALPQKHASTHMGGDDSVSGSLLPSPIVPGEEGEVGDATDGFAPIQHVHDTTALGSLAGVDVDIEEHNGQNLALVHAPQLFSLLQEILFKLEQLEARMDEING